MIALYDYDPMELSPNVDMEVIDDKKKLSAIMDQASSTLFFQTPYF